MNSTIVFIASYLIIFIAFVCIRIYFVALRRRDEGTEDMKELAGIIRNGASTFLKQEYVVIIPTVLIFGLIYSLFTETFAGVALIFGAALNMCAVEIGMRAGTYANVRTTNAARVTGALSRTMRVALLGGGVSGHSVPAFGLLGFVTVLLLSGGFRSDIVGHGLIVQNSCNALAMRLGSYSLGFSLVAMFNRVAGGNYTKAADISADIVGKNKHDMPEDDSRMPNTVADFIGDCVNDIAGNISDLAESFVATPVACILISMQLFAGDPTAFNAACAYPLIIATGGLLSGLIGVSAVIFANRKIVIKDSTGTKIDVRSRVIDDPGHELNLATYFSAALVFVIGLVGAYLVFGNSTAFESFRYGWISPWLASLLGVVSSVAVGKITEYYTSTKYEPVKNLAEMAHEGDAFVVTEGDAIGYKSTLLPIAVIGASMIIAFSICGVYGIAISGLGMLSFVGTTVSIDAFGPIADNAGGIAESCHLAPEIREITDQLDAVGNTTAAIGKGNAIGSAAFATVALIMSYVHSYAVGDIGILSIAVPLVVGGIFGGALINYFSGMLTNNTITAARDLAVAGEKQLEIPGVLEGRVKPDYESIIKLAAQNALRHMLIPSVMALIMPIMLGFSFGPNFVLGLLIGSTIAAVTGAIYNGNSGGAFDNAKKSIEIELAKAKARHPGEIFDEPTKKAIADLEAAHKASVVGDTVGDTRKDVVGVALDIFIKTMSTVANTMAPLFTAFHLF